MIFFKKALDFFLYSNIFISVCSAALTAESFLLIHEGIHRLYVCFVFTSTLALYTFPVLVPENFLVERSVRHIWVRENKKLLVAIFSIAAAVTGVLVFFFPFKFTLCFAPLALIAFAYFFLRNVAGLKSFLVALVWTCVTAMFPVLLASGFEMSALWKGAGNAVLAQNFFFILPLCVIFNVRDIVSDREAGVRTIPVIYGVKTTLLTCLIFLGLFAAVVAFSTYLLEFRTGLLISAGITTVLIVFASEKRSDYYYSLWADGMILLQSGLVYIIMIGYFDC